MGGNSKKKKKSARENSEKCIRLRETSSYFYLRVFPTVLNSNVEQVIFVAVSVVHDFIYSYWLLILFYSG